MLIFLAVVGNAAAGAAEREAGTDHRRKADLALALFEQHVDAEALRDRLQLAPSGVVTPLMFEFQLIERARSERKRIVLPEGDDDRVLRAAATVLKRGIADLVILGEPFEVRARAIELGIDIQKAEVLSPFDAVHVARFAEEYERLRAHKGVTYAQAADTVTDVSYFGTLMVATGHAAGMVSGATHTTAATIRPALEVIRTAPGVSKVSGAFLMCLRDHVLVFADCAASFTPTSVLPVKLNFRMAGSSKNTVESATGSEVGSTWKTSAGPPAATHNSARRMAVSGDCSAGFRTTLHPAARAGAALRVIMAAGKFHGVMA